MYKRSALKKVWWPVTVTVPKDGGGVTRHTFECEFELLKQSEFDEVYSGGGTDRELLLRVTSGWRKYADEEGNDVPFTREALEAEIDTPFVRNALVAAYLQLSQGREAARKN